MAINLSKTRDHGTDLKKPKQNIPSVYKEEWGKLNRKIPRIPGVGLPKHEEFVPARNPFTGENMPGGLSVGTTDQRGGGAGFGMTGTGIGGKVVVDRCGVGIGIYPSVGFGARIGPINIGIAGLNLAPAELMLRSPDCQGGEPDQPEPEYPDDDDELPPDPEAPEPGISDDDIPEGYSRDDDGPPGTFYILQWSRVQKISWKDPGWKPKSGKSVARARMAWLKNQAGDFSLLMKRTSGSTTTGSYTQIDLYGWPYEWQRYWYHPTIDAQILLPFDYALVYEEKQPFTLRNHGRYSTYRYWLDTDAKYQEALANGERILWSPSGRDSQIPHKCKNFYEFSHGSGPIWRGDGYIVGSMSSKSEMNEVWVSPRCPAPDPRPPVPPDRPMPEKCCGDKLSKQILLELKRQNLALGVDEFVEKNKDKLLPDKKLPKAPERLTEVRKKGHKKQTPLKSLLHVQEFIIRQIDRAVGHLPFTAKIIDSDPSKKGNQKVEVEVTSLADGLKELIEVAIESAGDTDLTNLIAVRILYECGFIHQGAVQTWHMVDAICDYLDFKNQDAWVTVPFAFDPRAGIKVKKGFQVSEDSNNDIPENQRNLEKMMPRLLQPKDLRIPVRRWHPKEKKSQADLLQEIMRAATLAAQANAEEASPDRLRQLVMAAQAVLKLQNIQDVANVQKAITSGQKTRGKGGK